MVRKFNFIFWNVKGLNDSKKREVVRRVIAMHKSDIICLQETKLSQMDVRILIQIVGSQFTYFIVVDAINIAGGILLIWKINASSS
jgi:exonuclease III